MLFNTLTFAAFLPLVFILYWFSSKNNSKLPNIILLIASYYFYANWDYRFLFLLIFSTVLDYISGIKIQESKSVQTRKIWLWLSIGINLGFLGVFKYYNFFIKSFENTLSVAGIHLDTWTLSVILPVGISFYTFHGLSYIIDIYRNKIDAERNYIDYALFVSFFPLLVAGPIERATHLLPQLKTQRNFNYDKAIDGLKQILWGLFKKTIIADRAAVFVNEIFNNSTDSSGSTLVIVAVLFAFQIYCDFSGYSDIALGTAKLFGIDLLRNFAFPYFSRDIAEFWRRWHISLSSWFKDYLYIPLGGSKGGLLKSIRNTFIIFLVSGFWHGANWTFIFWGLLNAVYILPSILFKTNRNNMEIVATGRLLPNIKEFASIILTFCLTTFAWIFFRADNMSQAMNIVSTIFSKSLFSMPIVDRMNSLFIVIFFICLLIIVEWIGRTNQYAIANMFANKPKWVRLSFYYLLIVFIFLFAGSNQQFIYFQF